MPYIPLVNGSGISTDNEVRVGRAIHGRGSVTREYKTLKPTKTMCVGCRDNFYNFNGGMNGKGCWSFDGAKVVDKVGHSSIHVCGGIDTKMVKTLDCWNSVQK